MTARETQVSGSPLIIDVDTGVDDALALALAVGRGANILGVTTVAGNVPVEVATRNTLDVLSFLGREDIPVHRGASRPLVADYQDATHVHGDNGLGGVDVAKSGANEADLAGPAFIIQSATEYAGDLTLVTLGPLTNLAIALNVRPHITRQIRRVVVMGGAFSVPGNVTTHSEFNIYVDPEAAQHVFDAEWDDITIVGLDVTHQTVLSRELWERIPEGHDCPAALVRGVMARTFTERAMSGFYLHDPLAVAVALDPDLVEGAVRAVTVELSGATTRGKTTIEVAHRGPRVATSVRAAAFVAEFCAVLGLPASDATAGFENAE
jgi:inosine-uridine nucleoside N-ribohydrolase